MVKPNETNEILYFMTKSLGKTQRNQRNLIFYNYYDYYYYYYYYYYVFFYHYEFSSKCVSKSRIHVLLSKCYQCSGCS